VKVVGVDEDGVTVETGVDVELSGEDPDSSVKKVDQLGAL
jgi:hypothetical protein